MREPIATALAVAELPTLVALVIIAGLVRGFAGFGTALIYVPVAARYLEPAEVVVSLLIMDVFGPLPLLRRAWADGDHRQALQLSAGGMIGVPVGVWLLTRAEPETFRWVASLLALGLLVLVAGGVRFPGRPGGPLLTGIGTLSGVMGGFSGMSGPPVVLFQLGGDGRPAVIRANLLLFFTGLELAGLATFGLLGMLSPHLVALGLLLALPYTAATVAGAGVFRRRGDVMFRRAAYLLVGGAALSGLPLFGG